MCSIDYEGILDVFRDRESIADIFQKKRRKER